MQNEGGEEAITILLLDISKIEIIVGQGGQSDCMHRFNVLNNRGSNRHRE